MRALSQLRSLSLDCDRFDADHSMTDEDAAWVCVQSLCLPASVKSVWLHRIALETVAPLPAGLDSLGMLTVRYDADEMGEALRAATGLRALGIENSPLPSCVPRGLTSLACSAAPEDASDETYEAFLRNLQIGRAHV